jgi:hypothetical protein
MLEISIFPQVAFSNLAAQLALKSSKFVNFTFTPLDPLGFSPKYVVFNVKIINLTVLISKNFVT